MDGDGGNGQWLTYDQVADVRGTSRDAAIRWVQRRKLRRQPGNDGRVLVLVPPNVVADAGAPRAPQRAPLSDAPDAGDRVPPNAPPDVGEVWRAAIDALREQLVRADAREDELRAALERARAEAQHAKEAVRRAEEAANSAEAGQLQAQAETAVLRADVEAAHRLVTAAQERAAALEQAETERTAERRGQGRWARLRAAWRGEE